LLGVLWFLLTLFILLVIWLLLGLVFVLLLHDLQQLETFGHYLVVGLAYDDLKLLQV
jgi:uncharacterized membrane protein